MQTLPPEHLDGLAPYIGHESGPGDGPFRSLALEGVSRLAEKLKVPASMAMRLCLDQDIWPLRFARNRGVMSTSAQSALLDSRAAVIGCGGLGGHTVTLLARAGVGALTVCDGDSFSESNLNRQLLCRENNLGRNKAEVAAEELTGIASHAAINVYPLNITAENAREILSGADIILDCLDSMRDRLLLDSCARDLGVPLVHATIAGDEGFVSLIRPGENTLRLLYGSAAESGVGGAESVVGVPTVTPAATAALQAALSIHCLSGKKLPGGRLYHLDLLAPLLETLEL